jgi:hypothetical protein
MPTKAKAYHRVQDLKRLREQALPLPLIVSDNGEAYVVETDAVLDRQVLCAGRYQVVYEFLRGYLAGVAMAVSSQRPVVHEVGGPDAGPVAAPCCISGCQYSAFEAWRSAAQQVGEALATAGPAGYYALPPAAWQEWALHRVGSLLNAIELLKAGNAGLEAQVQGVAAELMAALHEPMYAGSREDWKARALAAEAALDRIEQGR